MKHVFFALTLALSFGALAQEADLAPACETREFSASSSSRFGSRDCQAEDAEFFALRKCRNAGYQNCQRLPGRRGIESYEVADMVTCTVTVRGEICEE
jgi:hypothetical protein